MAITTNLKKSDGVDLGNNLFAGNGTSNGNQTFNIIMKNGVDLGRGWYNKSSCKQAYGAVGFKNSAGTDVGTLLGKYGTLNCTCDTDIDNCHDTDGCFVFGQLLTMRGLVSISEIKVGDQLWGADENWHEVVGVASNVLGSRKVYSLPKGGVVTADHVIYQGQLAYVPSKKALFESDGAILEATNGVKGIYPVPGDVQEIDGAFLQGRLATDKTYSPITKDKCIGYLNGEAVLIAVEL